MNNRKLNYSKVNFFFNVLTVLFAGLAAYYGFWNDKSVEQNVVYYYNHAPEETVYVSEGLASYYGPCCEGNRTASGEIFNSDKLTAASTHLPFGTCLTVTNMVNGLSVDVRINDRGPFNFDNEGKAVFPLREHPSRVIDLSEAAMRKLEGIEMGVIPISYQEI